MANVKTVRIVARTPPVRFGLMSSSLAVGTLQTWTVT
jgi:hypothetical protein